MIQANRFSVAPMMNCTDRHYRYLARLITKRSMLYTEMLTADALIHGDRKRFLTYHSSEHPIALQLGGSSPNKMATCAGIAYEHGFDEVNINVGCPSNRVQAGKFGACLMLEPELVAMCIKEIKDKTGISATVKTRIGVDEHDSYEELYKFVGIIADAGCKIIIVHARKAHLSGLSPKENRTIPPLQYNFVYKLKHDYPNLKIVLNGGVDNKFEILKHLNELDGVMVGRHAYENPFFLIDVDEIVFGEPKNTTTRTAVLENYKQHILAQIAIGVPLRVLIKPILGLFNGIPGAKIWRRYLSENVNSKDADIDLIDKAQNFVVKSNKRALAI